MSQIFECIPIDTLSIRFDECHEAIRFNNGVQKIYRLRESLEDFNFKDIGEYLQNNNDLKVNLGELQYEELKDQYRDNKNADFRPNITHVFNCYGMKKVPIVIEKYDSNKCERIEILKDHLYVKGVRNEPDEINRDLEHIMRRNDFYEHFDVESVYKIRKWKCRFVTEKYKKLVIKYDIASDYVVDGEKFKESEESFNEMVNVRNELIKK